MALLVTAQPPGGRPGPGRGPGTVPQHTFGRGTVTASPWPGSHTPSCFSLRGAWWGAGQQSSHRTQKLRLRTSAGSSLFHSRLPHRLPGGVRTPGPQLRVGPRWREAVAGVWLETLPPEAHTALGGCTRGQGDKVGARPLPGREQVLGVCLSLWTSLSPWRVVLPVWPHSIPVRRRVAPDQPGFGGPFPSRRCPLAQKGAGQCWWSVE